LLLSIHEFLASARIDRPDKTGRAWDDNTYIPERVLRAAPFQSALTDVLVRCISDPKFSEKPRGFQVAAVTYLTPDKIDRFAAACPRPTGDEQLTYETSRDIADTLAARRLAPASLLRLLMEKVGGESWERSVALLYHLGGESGRKAARELAAVYELPQA